MTHAYDTKFMNYTDLSSRHAAEAVARLMLGTLPIRSVLDVGCAKGTWLGVWKKLGADDVQGVDGDYVKRDELRIPQDRFLAADLSRPLDLGRRFDLVQTLEVAEHIEASAAATFVENLAKHSSGVVLFSAAPPGQGGEFHVNEQPYEYWRERFRRHDFHVYDWIRPHLAGDARISFWYRYNTFLYIRSDVARTLPSNIAAMRVPDDQPLTDISPALFRLRKGVVRLLPYALRDGLARFKANYLPSGRW